MALETWNRQAEFNRRFEWGPSGVEAIGDCRVAVIVDVLRFTTAVDAATSRGVTVYPYRWHDDSAADFARSVGARLADGSDPNGPSLSPRHILRLDPGDSIVLPSPNGSTCAILAGESGAKVIASCLRNAAAVGAFLHEVDEPVSVIACGERWPDGSLRPAVEDYLGAGAVLARLGGLLSPEARAAVAAWHDLTDVLEKSLFECSSGKELAAKGHAEDIRYASAAGASESVPLLQEGSFRPAVSI